VTPDDGSSKLKLSKSPHLQSAVKIFCFWPALIRYISMLRKGVKRNLLFNGGALSQSRFLKAQKQRLFHGRNPPDINTETLSFYDQSGFEWCIQGVLKKG